MGVENNKARTAWGPHRCTGISPTEEYWKNILSRENDYELSKTIERAVEFANLVRLSSRGRPDIVMRWLNMNLADRLMPEIAMTLRDHICDVDIEWSANVCRLVDFREPPLACPNCVGTSRVDF